LEKDNPVPLKRHSLHLEDKGRSVRVRFSFLTIQCDGEVLLDDAGRMEGFFHDGYGKGRYVGAATWKQRPYSTHPPRPCNIPEREPTSVMWQAPACMQDGRVFLLGVGGASRSGKGTVSKRVAELLVGRGLDTIMVHQDLYIRQAGSYIHPGKYKSVEVDNFETPSSISWRDFAKAITAAAKKVAPESKGRGIKPGVVIAEGFLLYWMLQLNEAFHVRIFLRASQQEICYRRQQSKPLPEPFLEHVFWPAHLAYGQPQAAAHEIVIPNGQQDYPLPASLLKSALEVILSHGGDALSRALTRKAAPAPSATKESILSMFRTLDPSGTGVINRQEFDRVLKALDAVTWNDATISKVLSAVNAKCDGGRVDYTAFLEWVFGSETPGSRSHGTGTDVQTTSQSGSEARRRRNALAADGALPGAAPASGSQGACVPEPPRAGTPPADCGPWPFAKLRAALAAWSAPRPRLGFAVVLMTGAMNPIHLGHVQMLHQARKRLEAKGYGVVGAWASPSHDDYVQPKARSNGTMAFSAAFRLEIARRAMQSDSLVDVGSWEAHQKGQWPDFPEVVANLQQELKGLVEANAMRGPQGLPQVFYVCGTDHAEKCRLYDGLHPERDIGVVVVPRTGDRAEGERSRELVFVAKPAEGDTAGFSSTQVRSALANRDYEAASLALSPEAARLLLRPTAKERAAFTADYAKFGVQLPMVN